MRRRAARAVSVVSVPWLVGSVARGSLHWRHYGALDAAGDYATGAGILVGCALLSWLFADEPEPDQ